ncbi:hypothetical protein ACIPY3_02690 [Paenarthrobacter sp. NPDC089714]|uniref:hypothetical protein n=1 Tax=Paenarthrobacter sp. NPDC089714 TaxID=3364377 RepID=UPI00381447BC
MPEWVTNLTVGEIVLFLAGVGGAVAGAVKVLKPVRQFIKKLGHLAEDWHGVPERVDGSGQVIEPARPGVMAQLETLRAQVQNSHKTNLREDLDAVHDSVKVVTQRLDAHIATTEERRAKADELSRVVKEDIVPVAAQLKEQISEGKEH